MSAPIIRFIVTTVSSECDANGNTYHFARVRSTITGKTFTYESGAPSNAPYEVMRATGLAFDALDVHTEALPRKAWKRAATSVEYFSAASIVSLIRDLEK